jgi:hypothetical protein
MIPAGIGDTSPAVTATMASSSNATPSAATPIPMSARPWACHAVGTRSASPKAKPIVQARRNASYEPS